MKTGGQMKQPFDNLYQLDITLSRPFLALESVGSLGHVTAFGVTSKRRIEIAKVFIWLLAQNRKGPFVYETLGELTNPATIEIRAYGPYAELLAWVLGFLNRGMNCNKAWDVFNDRYRERCATSIEAGIVMNGILFEYLHRGARRFTTYQIPGHSIDGPIRQFLLSYAQGKEDSECNSADFKQRAYEALNIAAGFMHPRSSTMYDSIFNKVFGETFPCTTG